MDETLFETQQPPGRPRRQGHRKHRKWSSTSLPPPSPSGASGCSTSIQPRLHGLQTSDGNPPARPLEASVLADALAGLVMRHETLRTAFDEEEGEPVS